MRLDVGFSFIGSFFGVQSRTMPADYAMATLCLQENLRLVDGNRTPEQAALWNLSNALLVVCDGLREIDAGLRTIESQKLKERSR
jgi:hypothetical protein